jgi:hypothetical protein
MRKPVGILLAMALFPSTGCQFEGPISEAGEAGASETQGTPEELVTTWVEMWNAYDLDQVGELFLTNDQVSYFSSEFEGAIWGFEGVMEHHEGFGFIPGGEVKGTRLWVEGLAGARFQEMAVLTGIWYFERGGEEGSDPVSDPVAPPQRGPVTFVCVVEQGEWRFAHMNFGNYLETDGE